MELASETRCDILQLLENEKKRPTEIAKKLGLTVQETHRNTERLSKEGLISKDSDGFFFLTKYGQLVVSQIPFFQFITENKKFVEDNSISHLPHEFIQRLGSFAESKIIKTVPAVMQQIKQLESSAKKELKIMVNQAWPEEGSILAEKAKNNVLVFALIGKNTIFPKDVVNNIQKEIDKLAKEEKLHTKMIDRVDVSVYIADNKAAVMFLNKEGEPDMSSILTSEEPNFLKWCNDIFDENWKNAKRFDVSKTVQV